MRYLKFFSVSMRMQSSSPSWQKRVIGGFHLSNAGPYLRGLGGVNRGAGDGGGSGGVPGLPWEGPEACPACRGRVLIKSGHACGRQRWKCKGCGRQFTRTEPRGKPAEVKRRAI